MTLFYYVVREFYKYFLGSTVLLLFLFSLFDFIHKTTRYFVKYPAEPEQILQMYAYQLPFQLLQILPIAALFASVITVVLLNRGNEVTVMRAAGMGVLKISAPLIFCGISLATIGLVVGEVILPDASTKMHYVKSVQIEGRSPEGIASGAQWIKQGNRLFSYDRFVNRSKLLEDVKLISVSRNFRISKQINAVRAKYLPEKASWMLLKGTETHYSPEGTVVSQSVFAERELQLPIKFEKLRKDFRRPEELSSAELSQIITRGQNSGKDVLAERVAMHLKWSIPFAAMIISLIGIKFGYVSERATDILKGVAIAFAIGIGYWFFLSAGRALALRGDIAPAIGAWAPNLITAVLMWGESLHSMKA